MSKKLSLQERKFVAEYLLDMNVREAGIRSGGAPTYGTFMMRKPQVRLAIDQALRRLEETCTFSTVRVLEEAALIAMADPRRVVQADGQILPLPEMPEDVARAVSSLKVTTRTLKDGGTEVVSELKFWDKNSAISTILKSLGKDGEKPAVVIHNAATTISAAISPEDQATLRALDNQLRALLGKDPLPAEEPLPHLPDLKLREPDRVADETSDEEEDLIEAAMPADLEPEEFDPFG